MIASNYKIKTGLPNMNDPRLDKTETIDRINALLDEAIYRLRIKGFYNLVLAHAPANDNELIRVMRQLIKAARLRRLMQGYGGEK